MEKVTCTESTIPGKWRFSPAAKTPKGKTALLAVPAWRKFDKRPHAKDAPGKRARGYSTH